MKASSIIVVEESLIEPPAWYQLDLATGQRDLLKRREVPGYDRRPLPAPSGGLATASDGTADPGHAGLSRVDRAGRLGTVPALRLRGVRGLLGP